MWGVRYTSDTVKNVRSEVYFWHCQEWEEWGTLLTLWGVWRVMCGRRCTWRCDKVWHTWGVLQGRSSKVGWGEVWWYPPHPPIPLLFCPVVLIYQSHNIVHEVCNIVYIWHVKECVCDCTDTTQRREINVVKRGCWGTHTSVMLGLSVAILSQILLAHMHTPFHLYLYDTATVTKGCFEHQGQLVKSLTTWLPQLYNLRYMAGEVMIGLGNEAHLLPGNEKCCFCLATLNVLRKWHLWRHV